MDVGSRRRRCVLMALVAFVPATASGNIDLEWRPTSQTVSVGAAVNLGLYAVSDSAEDQSLSAVELVFGWDPTHLQLMGLSQSGAVSLLYSGFPTSGDCDLNEEVPPQDGDGFYRAWAHFGDPVDATPEGTLLTTFQFEALVGTSAPAEVLMLNSSGSGDCRTVVIDGDIPGLDVLGELYDAAVTITCANSSECDDGLFCNGAEACDGDSCVAGADPCPGQWCDEVADVCVDCPSNGDFDDDCDVDLDDYEFLFGCFTGPLPTRAGDDDDDGDVDLDDFATWRPCLAGPGVAPGGGCGETDLDADNDVDLEDYAEFQEAFTGPALLPGCYAADFDADNDVDLDDFARFQEGFTGRR